jgi:hypothetical protein
MKRKSLIREKEEKAPVQRKKKIKVDLSTHKSVFDSDGKFSAKENDQVFFVRTVERGKQEIHEGSIMKVHSDSVMIWDESKGQQWSVSFSDRERVTVVLKN